MFVYFMLVGIPAIISIFGIIKKTNRRKLNKIIINTFFTIIIIILCFRHESMGCDVWFYELYYSRLKEIPLNELFLQSLTGEGFEFGFSLIAKIFASLAIDFRIVLIFITLFSVIPIKNLYKTNEEGSALLSIILWLNLGLFPIYFSALRQVMAMALVVPAYKFVKENKIIPYLFVVLLAMLFHRSAFIMIALYPVYHMKLSRRKLFYIGLPTLGIVFVLKNRIFTIIAGIVKDFYTIETSETGAFAIFLLMSLFVIYSLCIVDEKCMDEESKGLRNILFFCTLLQSFSGVHPLAMRLNYYYITFIPLFMCKIEKRTSGKNRLIAQIAVIIIIIFFTMYYYYKAYTGSDILQIYPYISMWHSS